MMEQAPLPQIIENLGKAIAEAQFNIDRYIIDALKVMADQDIEIPGHGAKSMLELGLLPSFYHFTEMNINVRLALSSMEGEEFGIGGGISGGKPGVFGASLNASYSNKYSFSAESASEINTRIVSIPVPQRLNDLLDGLIENAASQDEDGG